MFDFMYRLFENADRPRLLDRQVDELVFRIGPGGIAAMVLAVILWAALVTLLVLLIVYFIRQIRHYPAGRHYPEGPAASSGGPQASSQLAPGGLSQTSSALPASAEALRLLDERYARGEMGHEEYLTRRSNLLGITPHIGSAASSGETPPEPPRATPPDTPPSSV